MRKKYLLLVAALLTCIPWGGVHATRQHKGFYPAIFPGGTGRVGLYIGICPEFHF